MTKYLSVDKETVHEFTIERSRFIGYLAHTEGEEEARAYLQKVRSSHPLATHVCYGFIADREGNLQRFSDDGEPQGTAGMPILGVLKAKELRLATAAVVRYFGGIKLGAGGLVRAYTQAAAQVVEKAETKLFCMSAMLEIEVDYPEVSPCLKFLEGKKLTPISSEYGEKATFLVAVKTEDEGAFTAQLLDALSGRVRLKRGENCFFPFPPDPCVILSRPSSTQSM